MTLPSRLAAVRVHETRRGATAFVVLGCSGDGLANYSQALATAGAGRYCPRFGNVLATPADLRRAAASLGATIEEPTR